METSYIFQIHQGPKMAFTFSHHTFNIRKNSVNCLTLQQNKASWLSQAVQYAMFTIKYCQNQWKSIECLAFLLICFTFIQRLSFAFHFKSVFHFIQKKGEILLAVKQMCVPNSLPNCILPCPYDREEHPLKQSHISTAHNAKQSRAQDRRLTLRVFY